ncbi:MAG: hypothetical protein R2849_11480 [Thermomicrobiales bacterium]
MVEILEHRLTASVERAVADRMVRVTFDLLRPALEDPDDHARRLLAIGKDRRIPRVIPEEVILWRISRTFELKLFRCVSIAPVA